tara:strand:+ start:63 stop:536 length:474 start_codon:yes stop_codon:yes gene_type:complete
MNSIEFKSSIINQMMYNDNYINSYDYEEVYSNLEAEADLKAIESKRKQMEQRYAVDKQLLFDNHMQRMNCWAIVQPILLKSISDERSTGKGVRIRKYVIKYLQYTIDNPCDWLEDDKLQVGRIGIGIWKQKYLKAFNHTEQYLILNVIAKEWGACDY